MERAKHGDRVVSGREALTIYARPEKNVGLLRWRDEEISATMAGELERWLALPRHFITEGRVQRGPYAVPSSDPGAGRRVDLLRDSVGPIWAAGD